MSLTLAADALITQVLHTLEVIGANEPASQTDLQLGFSFLQELIDSWAIQDLTVLTIQRSVYNLNIATAVSSITSVSTLATVTTTAAHGFLTGDVVTIAGASPVAYNGSYTITVTGLQTFTYVFAGGTSPATGTITATVANQGGPDHPYTLGPGGTWNTGTNARPRLIQWANLLLNTSTPPVEIPIAVITTQMYATATPIKTLLNQLPVTLYYVPTVPLGTVYLWPLPTQGANQVVLYTPLVTGQFIDHTTAVVLAPGYLSALRLNLCKLMMSSFAVPAETRATIPEDAREALQLLKESNAMVQMAELMLDPAYTPSVHGTYVIQTDQGA